MHKDRAYDILEAVRNFDKLERVETDKIGWIALRYSTTRGAASRMLAAAQALVAEFEKE